MRLAKHVEIYNEIQITLKITKKKIKILWEIISPNSATYYEIAIKSSVSCTISSHITFFSEFRAKNRDNFCLKTKHIY